MFSLYIVLLLDKASNEISPLSSPSSSTLPGLQQLSKETLDKTSSLYYIAIYTDYIRTQNIAGINFDHSILLCANEAISPPWVL